MKYIISIVFALLLTGCTYSNENISINGKATDVIDKHQEANADLKPTIEKI